MASRSGRSGLGCRVLPHLARRLLCDHSPFIQRTNVVVSLPINIANREEENEEVRCRPPIAMWLSPSSASSLLRPGCDIASTPEISMEFHSLRDDVLLLRRMYGSKAKRGKREQERESVGDDEFAIPDSDEEAEEEERKEVKGAKGTKGEKAGKVGKSGKGKGKDKDKDKSAMAANASGRAKGGSIADSGGEQMLDLSSTVAVAKEQMEEAMEAMRKELAKLRTGRASPGMLDHVIVDSYGVPFALSHVATVTVRDAQLLAVAPYDSSLVVAVERGIAHSPMGLSPSVAGDVVLVPVPRLTQETRQAMVKLAMKAAEGAKVSVRRARKVAMDAIKQAEEIFSEDECKRKEKQIQELTNTYTKLADDIFSSKEKDIMSG